MSRRLLDFNPLTGESVFFEDNGKEGFALTHTQSAQSVQSILEMNKHMANLPERTNRGIKQNWWHHSQIPNVIAMKWKNELGVDIFNRNHRKKMFQLLESPEYRYLKTTHKKHIPKR
jgi:hypothetical protein